MLAVGGFHVARASGGRRVQRLQLQPPAALPLVLAPALERQRRAAVERPGRRASRAPACRRPAAPAPACDSCSRTPTARRRRGTAGTARGTGAPTPSSQSLRRRAGSPGAEYFGLSSSGRIIPFSSSIGSSSSRRQPGSFCGQLLPRGVRHASPRARARGSSASPARCRACRSRCCRSRRGC